MSELLYSIQNLIFWTINCIMLAVYFGAYLSPKSTKLPAKAVFAAFGAAYFVLQWLVHNLYALSPGSPVITAANTIILMSLVFLLSLVFFINNLRLNIFLLLSFFAAQEICTFIMTGIGQLFGNAHRYIVNHLVASGFFETSADFSAFLEGYAVMQFFAVLIIHATTIFLTLRSITKAFGCKDYAISKAELSYLLLPCLPGLAISHIIRAMLVSRNDFGVYVVSNDNPYIDLLMPLAGIILLLCLTASVKFFQKLAQLHEEQTQQAILNEQIAHLQHQIDDADGIYTEIRGFRHDLKSHVSNILALANAIIEGREEARGELEGYLGKIGETLDSFDFYYKTGSSVSDIIIHQKRLEAARKGIDLTADFIYPSNLNIDAYDMAVILVNALENAMEASSRLKSGKGFIRLNAYTKGKMFFIEVENSFEGNIAIDDSNGLPRSGKPDEDKHGIGLSNIRRCAKKYFGDIEFEIRPAKDEDYKVFHLTVMLQGRE